MARRERPPAPLLELGRSLHAELADAGIGDARPFHPHLTLARKCRGPFPRESVGPYEWDVDALALMQSHADVAGPRYVVLRQWRWAASSAAGHAVRQPR